MLLYSGQMCPPRHKRHLMASSRQERTEVASYTSCPHHCNAHRSTSVILLRFFPLSPWERVRVRGFVPRTGPSPLPSPGGRGSLTRLASLVLLLRSRL